MAQKITILLFFSLFICFASLGQSKAYFNQTELGFLLGKRAEQMTGQKENRIDISFITFHGVRINPNHVIGFSVGLDQYEDISIIPIALGWRGFLGQEGKSRIFAGLDIGGGSAILEKKTETEWNKNWYEGGHLISPSLGASFPSKKGKSALTLSFAYKHQQISELAGTFASPGSTQIQSDDLPPGFSSLFENNYLFRSFVFRAGLMF